MLSEIAYSEDRTILDLLKKLRSNGVSDSWLGKKVIEQIRERLGSGGEGQTGEEPIPYGYKSWVDLILPEDIEDCLEEYLQQGDMAIEEGHIKITSQGSRKLAKIARQKLEAMMREATGSHKVKETGHGWELAPSSRKYSFGDDYRMIDINKTCLNSLARGSIVKNSTSIPLAEEDLEVYEKTYESQMSIALLIDESASMGQEKRHAAIDACLALSKIREPQDLLKVFIFSSQVKEIPYWEIVNIHAPADITDIKLALQTARRALRNRKGNKQVYLITDTEPNTENNKYIGFEKAISGVLREVLNYRQNGITLNIAMLDENPVLRQFASQLAKLNGGQVYFTSPANLGKVVVENYLVAKRKSHHS